jgi:hypothetical protein
VWLIGKAVLGAVLLWWATRFDSRALEVVSITVLFVGPSMLAQSGLIVPLESTLIYIALVTVCSSAFGWLQLIPGPSVIAAIITPLIIHGAFSQHVLQHGGTAAQIPALWGLSALFATLCLVQISLTHVAARKPDFDIPLRAPVFLGQILAISEALAIAYSTPSIRDFDGIILVTLGLFPFLSSIYFHRIAGDTGFASTLLTLAVLTTAWGFFIEVRDPWSAVFFLLYALIIVAYAVHRPRWSSGFFAIVVLGLAVFKLYFEASSIFNDFKGTIVILAIGVGLLLLSFKLGKKSEQTAHE